MTAFLQDKDALSLFDGMGCAHIAMQEMGITPRQSFSSEIDKHAIAQVKLNFPWVKHLGDVLNWQSWPIDWARIGILFAGSPCQGFSFAGKQLAFDDPRSRLFFTTVDIWLHILKHNPDAKILFENVNMKREFMRVINEHLGLFPVNINSARVSAQNRDRWYWSNIRTRRDGLFGEAHTDIPQPADRGILLRDILEDNVPGKYYLSERSVNALIAHAERAKEAGNGFAKKPSSPDGKMNALKCGGAGTDDLVYDHIGRNRLFENLKSVSEKANTLLSTSYKGAYANGMTLVENNRIGGVSVSDRGIRFYQSDAKKSTLSEFGTCVFDDQKADALTTCHPPKVIQLNPAQEFGTQPRHQHRYYSPDGLSPALNTCQGGGLETKIAENGCIRRLTPTEYARLQTIPEWYKWGCSETQQYKMLGNGWTVEVIKHILQYL